MITGTLSHAWFHRHFFEDRKPGNYDGITWRLYWPPEIPDGATELEKIRAGQPFSTPSRFGVHLCGCLLHYDNGDEHIIWRLGPFDLDHNRILGVWPD